MFIILEGGDGAGKSTLVEEITKQCDNKGLKPFRYIHKVQPQQPARSWVLWDYAISECDEPWPHPDFGQSILADRWHWGEPVYGPLKRPETSVDGYGLLGKSGWRWVELFLESRGATVYNLTIPLSLAVQRVGERGDDYVETHELEQLYERYDWTSQQTISALRVRTDQYSTEYLAESIINTARARANAAKHLSAFPYYIGTLRPETLYVFYGSGRSLPAPPSEGTQMDTFLSGLHDALWKNIGLVDLNSPGVDFGRLRTALGVPRIVAMSEYTSLQIRNLGYMPDVVQAH